jgi:hypothetical protein
VGKFTAILSCLLASACATPAIDTRKYEFLWEKNISSGCIAAFHRDSHLYLINRGLGNVIFVSVYDPRSGLLATTRLNRRYAANTCREINFAEPPLDQPVALYIFESASFQDFFTKAKTEPQALLSAISAGPPYFTQDGKWNNEITTVDLGNGIRLESPYVYGLSGELKQFTRLLADKMYVRRKGEIARNEVVAKKQSMEFQEARDRWSNRLSQKIAVGDKVCTFEKNLFGYVEAVNSDKVKVHVVGAGSWGSGYFFSGIEGRFDFTRVEAIRWFDRAELGRCHFGY